MAWLRSFGVTTVHTGHAPGALIESGNVGRAVGGTLSIDDAGAITGTGSESTLATITWTGMAAGFGDGTVSLSLDYQGPQLTDTRKFVASAGSNVVLALGNGDCRFELSQIARTISLYFSTRWLSRWWTATDEDEAFVALWLTERGRALTDAGFDPVWRE